MNVTAAFTAVVAAVETHRGLVEALTERRAREHERIAGVIGGFSRRSARGSRRAG